MSLRGVRETVAKVSSRVETSWARTVAAEQRPLAADQAGGTALAGPSWPHRFSVGRAASADLGADFGTYVRQLGDWRDWAKTHDVELIYATRMVAGTRQVAVSHIVIPDLDTAAHVVGGAWPELIATARTRAAVLHHRFPNQPNLHRAVLGATRLSNVDFDVLAHVCHYFLERAEQATAAGVPLVPLTPRQVPIEGVHAKWLDSHHGLVRTVTGLDDLTFLPPHPARFHFTYLDPDHLDAHGRRHDSYSDEDHLPLPYEPQVVLISENKDTAIGFPRVRGGIAIEGEGRGANTIASSPWVRSAPLVVYWGDLDQDGLEILNEFREKGLAVTSMLMDVETYRRYQRYGTTHDQNGKPVKLHPPRDVPRLVEHEAELYRLLSSTTAPVPRVEQERIPLEVAEVQLLQIVRLSGVVGAGLVPATPAE
jgi:hypothetical protein